MPRHAPLPIRRSPRQRGIALITVLLVVALAADAAERQ
ncbi:hypothetical protein B1M_32622 [Burkholderia sp. TJI49]|nr:hypothetical protein B1M_32622 [Burkholderia sp. TJI49]